MQTGKLVIFCAPSGAGKTTVIKSLLKENFQLEFSVSATSREKREGEEDGIDYYFLEAESFRKKISEEKFVEWEEVYPGVFYGTLKSEIERLSRKGKNIVFDVDVVGAVNLKKLFGKDSVLVFIMTPSVEELKQRLINRCSDSKESIENRVSKARKEIEYYKQNIQYFDAAIENDKIENAVNQAKNILNKFLV